jgi:ribonuclease J|tara:strand:- start:1405 stop:2721 length:1317 start_codon:yes stop_codon:yes gene_type:complete
MEILPVGGYEEVGRNMTLIKSKDDAVIIDMGIRLDRVMIHEDTDTSKLSKSDLVGKGIIPDDSKINDKIKAIIVSHGHLDHLGAISIMASKYNVPIIAAPYTMALIKKDLSYRRKKKLKNPLKILEQGKTIQISPNMSIEFVRVAHSIPQASMIVVHTSEGNLVYALDFKFDDSPGIGRKPDYKRLKDIGKEGVKVLIVETTRVQNEGRTPSERIAKNLLEDNFLKVDDSKALVVTTFSSHIARINSIVRLAYVLDRTPVLLGRSMEKYVGIAERLNLIDLPSESHIYGNPNSIKKSLKRIKKEGIEKSLLVVTGHQGEPDALLTRMSKNKVPFQFSKGDQVMFSADVIPSPINVANRFALEELLKMKGVRLYKGLHVSGHASMEDHRDLLNMLQPENVIPSHGNLKMLATYAEIAENEGYTLNKDLFLVRNGQKVNI